jgi:hypothetical protein
MAQADQFFFQLLPRSHPFCISFSRQIEKEETGVRKNQAPNRLYLIVVGQDRVIENLLQTSTDRLATFPFLHLCRIKILDTKGFQPFAITLRFCIPEEVARA